MAGAGERANYFYCVRVTDPETHKNIKDALDWVVDKEPQFENFCYTPEMLHVTMAEVSLQSEEDIKRASQVLTDCHRRLKDLIPNSPLVFKGISDFHSKVMIAKVKYENDFLTFADHLRSQAKEAGVNVVENHEFNPHMTILKVSGVKARKAKVGNINPWVYVNMKETPFGQQQVRSVHLCKMGTGGKGPDGFYLTPAEIQLC